MTKSQESRRLGFAMVLLILAFGMHGQCAPAQAGEEQIIPPCPNGEIRVSAETNTTIQCVDGEWDAIVTATESEERVRNVCLLGVALGLILGLIFGTQIGRQQR